MKKISIAILMLVGMLYAPSAWAVTAAADSAKECSTCVYAAAEGPAAHTWDAAMRVGGVLLVIGLATAYAWAHYRKRLYVLGGIVAGVLVGGSYAYSWQAPSGGKAACSIAENLPPPREGFFAIDTSEFKSTDHDEFQAVGNEFADANEEKTAAKSTTKASAKTDTTSTDGFAAAGDEFGDTGSEFAAADSTAATPSAASNAEDDENGFESHKELFYETLVLLILTAALGFLVKYKIVRSARGFVMLASVIYLGFVQGACPCMIMSLQDVELYLLGNPVHWVAMMWFLGLVVVTYFFGKTWCGWLCHLGAFQDFLFRPSAMKWLTTAKSQRIAKRVQIGLLVVLVAQVAITRSNLWVKYDPFKVAFNLMSANTTGYVLLVLLLVSSVLIYRPFCRTACPVGLILGWVAQLPGARKLAVEESSCTVCRSCTRHCKQHSLGVQAGKLVVDNHECILCGDCMGSCKHSSLVVKNIKTWQK